MNASDIYRYSERGVVDKAIDAMRDRIVAERRPEIGVNAARREAQEVTADHWRAEYMRVEHEVTARWGVNA